MLPNQQSQGTETIGLEIDLFCWVAMKSATAILQETARFRPREELSIANLRMDKL